MGWLGAIAGGGIGAMLGGPLGALIGAGIGHMLTPGGGTRRVVAAGRTGAAGAATAETEQAQAVFIATFFACLAKMAKADGVVSPAEAQYIRGFIDRQFSGPEREFIHRVFNEARDNQVSYQVYLRQFNELAGNNRELKQTLLVMLAQLAASDGKVEASEREILQFAEELFGMPGFTRAAGAGSAGGSDSRRNAPQADVADAYRILDCSVDASDAEVKSAYRKKCIEFHPDKIQSKGLPPQFVEFAKNEMQKINEAYETICRARRTA